MKAIITIKIEPKQSPEQELLLSEVAKNELLSDALKEQTKNQYLTMLDEILTIDPKDIDIQIDFVEGNQ